MLTEEGECLRELKWSQMKAKKKNEIAQAMVAMRNKKLSPSRRKEIASDAAKARWKDKPAKKGKAASTSSKPTTGPS